MLLRSSSTPILNSWIPSSRESSPDSDSLRKLSRSRSGSVSFSISASLNLDDNRYSSDLDSQESLLLSKKNTTFRPPRTVPKPVRLKEKDNTPRPMVRVLSSSGLGAEGEGTGSGGGEGRGPDGGDGFGSYHDNTDAYYRNTIEANPGNALLLANYARFLKEVKKDYERAEEYCGRAILANPTDGNVLSLYADLVWQIHNDADRAEAYFQQAVKTNPADCYVEASYARFLWDAEDDDEEEDNKETEEKGRYGTGKETASSPMIFGGITQVSSNCRVLTSLL